MAVELATNLVQPALQDIVKKYAMSKIEGYVAFNSQDIEREVDHDPFIKKSHEVFDLQANWNNGAHVSMGLVVLSDDPS